MENHRKLIVGYDLAEDYSQICCYSYKTFEPVTISVNEDESGGMIPTVLGINTETRAWYIGQQAKDLPVDNQGFVIDGLLEKVKNGASVEILGQRITGEELLEKYLRKTLSLLKHSFPNESITYLVITVDEMDERLSAAIYQALSLLGIDRDRAMVMNRGGAYLYYALSQEKALWMNDVGLFDFNAKGLFYYQISINRRTTPMIAAMEMKDFSEQLSMSMVEDETFDFGYVFGRIAEQVLHKQIVTTLYFTGQGFEGVWARDAIKSLCTGRRVFLGQNLYSKGACYGAKELSGDTKLENLILLNNDMLLHSISLKLYCDGAMKDMMISDIGTLWYEMKQSVEVLVEAKGELELSLRNIITRENRREVIELDQLPKREGPRTRLHLSFSMEQKSKLLIRVEDLGFGEIHQSTGLFWEYRIDI